MISIRMRAALSCARCGVLFLFLVTSAAWSIEVPLDSIPDQGQPAFFNNVTVTMNSGKFEIRGRKNFAYFDGADVLPGTDADWRLRGKYDSSGLTSLREFKLKGKIPVLDIGGGNVLVTADINEWNLTDDPLLWGFKTSNIVCSPLLLINCTTDESIYVHLLAPFDSDFSFSGKRQFGGLAVTTVPVPAAAWLFGSALLLLAWVRRAKAG